VAADLADARRRLVEAVRVPIHESDSVVRAEPAAASVVIVNFNAGPVLRDCIQSVLGQARQVVVVDNASEPAGFEVTVAPFADDPRVVVIRSERNLGFAAGCNLGITACTEHTILLLNPDSIVHPGALGRLCEVLHSRAQVGMVGGYLICPDGTEQGGGRRAVPTPWRSAVRAFGLSRLGRRWPKLFDDFYLHLQPLPPEPVAVEAISGACMLLKREALDAVGWMDEAYFLHCEDLDLCMRFRRGGWVIQFVPDAPVVHHKGACSHDRRLQVEWHKHRGMMRFYRTHFHHQYPAGMMGLVWLGVWARFFGVAGLLVTRSLPMWAARGVDGLVTARRRPAERVPAVLPGRVSSGSVAS